MKPKISIILCTYNGGPDVKRCIDSILLQKEKSFEVLCLDGGSTDGTIELIKSYSSKDKRIKYYNNPNKLPEGHGNGKWLGFRKARGEIVGILDQDNILQRNSVFSDAIFTLEKEKDAFGALGGLKHDINDAMVVRYVSLIGTDSFFAYRSVDFLRYFKKLIYKKYNSIQYRLLPFSRSHIWITGGNCFFYRKRDVEKIGGYDCDVSIVPKFVFSGKNNLILLPDATKHYAESSLNNLLLKKFKWGKTYFDKTPKPKAKNFSYLSSTRDKILILMNLFACITILPYFLFSLYLYPKNRDPVILLFPIHAALTTIAYAFSAVKSKLLG